MVVVVGVVRAMLAVSVVLDVVDRMIGIVIILVLDILMLCIR
jgi:hypothetical protein